jgi:hypothetical protein
MQKKATRRWLFRLSAKADYLLAASEAASAGAEASEAGAEAASAGAGAAAGASAFLPQATRAAAAKRVANRSDFFMSISLRMKVKQFLEIVAVKYCN